MIPVVGFSLCLENVKVTKAYLVLRERFRSSYHPRLHLLVHTMERMPMITEVQGEFFRRGDTGNAKVNLGRNASSIAVMIHLFVWRWLAVSLPV